MFISQWTNVINLLHTFKIKTIDDNLRNKIINIITWMTSKRIEFDAVGYFPIDLSIGTGVINNISYFFRKIKIYLFVECFSRLHHQLLHI